jgi:hypothetical protein
VNTGFYLIVHTVTKNVNNILIYKHNYFLLIFADLDKITYFNIALYMFIQNHYTRKLKTLTYIINFTTRNDV